MIFKPNLIVKKFQLVFSQFSIPSWMEKGHEPSWAELSRAETPSARHGLITSTTIFPTFCAGTQGVLKERLFERPKQETLQPLLHLSIKPWIWHRKDLHATITELKSTGPLHVLYFLAVGSWVTWLFSSWERKICFQSWANLQSDNYFHLKGQPTRGKFIKDVPLFFHWDTYLPLTHFVLSSATYPE